MPAPNAAGSRPDELRGNEQISARSTNAKQATGSGELVNFSENEATYQRPPIQTPAHQVPEAGSFIASIPAAHRADARYQGAGALLDAGAMRYVISKVHEEFDGDPMTKREIPKVRANTMAEARMMADKFKDAKKGFIGVIWDGLTKTFVN